MRKFASLSALLADYPDLTEPFNTSALVRFLPDGCVIVVPDVYRGTLELEPGIDLVFAKVEDEGPSIGFNGEVPKEYVDGLVEAMPVKVDRWRFGSAHTGEIVVFGPSGEKKVLRANTVIFDDHGDTIGLQVGEMGLSIGVEVPTEQPATGAQA